MELIKAIFGNILGIDGFIIILILLNIFLVGNMTRRLSAKAEKVMRKVVYKPIDEIVEKLGKKEKEEELDLHTLKANIESQHTWYQIFISVTSIMPLLGILGTVISLLGITALEQTVIQANFLTALSSTFWGIVGAIICRIIEGTLTPVVERNQDNFELLINKIR